MTHQEVSTPCCDTKRMRFSSGVFHVAESLEFRDSVAVEFGLSCQYCLEPPAALRREGSLSARGKGAGTLWVSFFCTKGFAT